MNSENDHVVRIEGLMKCYGDIRALDGLEMKIARGCLYGLIGPNGSGKSTAIKTIMGLVSPDTGRIEVLGEEAPLKKNLHRIGYMPQDLAIYQDISVWENLEAFAGLYSLSKDELKRSAKEVLKMVDLEHRKDSLVRELSGGMKHRVSLACALVHSPDVIFLDEPTVGVDPELRVRFWDYFNELKRKGRTVIITTHYMDEALRCDMVGMIRGGRLIAENTASELMRMSGTENLEDAFLRFSRGLDK